MLPFYKQEAIQAVRDEVPDSSILRPKAFSRKNVTKAERDTTILKEKHCGYCMTLSSLLCKRGKHNHGSQTTCCHIQKGNIYIITEAPVNSVKNTSLQSKNHIQDLFMADWLSRQNHNKNKDEDITGMQITINAMQSTTNIS